MPRQTQTREGTTMTTGTQEETRRYRQWVEAVLANDETSTDDEMVAYFQREGGMSAAKLLVATRMDFVRGDR